MRGYQRDFSLRSSNVHNFARRKRKAATMVAVLRDVFGARLPTISVLDVGASTGAISATLAEHVADVRGIDIDAHAIAIAQENFGNERCKFSLGDAMALDFDDASFDALVCAHAYEHVPDPRQLMREIMRVLKPGGWCYFAAGNRLAIDEPHHHLPFLSVLPRPLAHAYLRVAGKGTYYYEEHQTYWQLQRLVQAFTTVDYTRRLIAEPEHFATAYMVAAGSRKQRLALWLVDHAMWLCPSYVWLLKKPGSAN